MAVVTVRISLTARNALRGRIPMLTGAHCAHRVRMEPLPSEGGKGGRGGGEKGGRGGREVGERRERCWGGERKRESEMK